MQIIYLHLSVYLLAFQFIEIGIVFAENRSAEVILLSLILRLLLDSILRV